MAYPATPTASRTLRRPFPYGVPGDAYGATNELAEAAALIAAVGLLPHGWIEPLPEMLGAI